MSKEVEQLPSLKGDVGNEVHFYVDESKSANDVFSRRIVSFALGTTFPKGDGLTIPDNL